MAAEPRKMRHSQKLLNLGSMPSFTLFLPGALKKCVSSVSSPDSCISNWKLDMGSQLPLAPHLISCNQCITLGIQNVESTGLIQENNPHTDSIKILNIYRNILAKIGRSNKTSPS